ncbi:MAG TPA: pyridoxal phosphate-dependent aminotransferase [Terriglobales bacterium]|nr:pyridoxal phosphate-dependent aminotransferase [Terriglobales bacterium]
MPPAAFALRLAAPMRGIGIESSFDVLHRARQLEAQGRTIIHLEIGEPDFATPEHIQEAAYRAMRDGYTHYTPSAGLPALREAVAEHVARSHRVPVDPEEVVIVPGGKPTLFNTMLALIERGDEVIYPDPGFPIYESMAKFLGAALRPIRLREELGFRMDIGEIEAALSPRTRLIILNSPHNPTGGMMTREDVQRLARAVAATDAMVLTDEIYQRIVFEGAHHSIFSEPGMRERTVLMDGFSKAYAMTGWRLGYGVMPREFAKAVTRVIGNSTSCTAAFTQMAGVAALRGDQAPVARMVAEFRRRRDLCVPRINQLPGFRCRMPQGAFYAFPNIEATGFTARELQDRLLEEAGVAALSGTAFGPGGEGYLRFSLANSLENINEAIDRIAAWLDRQRTAGQR